MKESLQTLFLFMGAWTGLFSGRAVVGLDSFQMWMNETGSPFKSQKQIHMLLLLLLQKRKKFLFVIYHLKQFLHTHLMCAAAAAAVPLWEEQVSSVGSWPPGSTAPALIGWNEIPQDPARLSCSCCAGLIHVTSTVCMKCLCVWEHVFRIFAASVGLCRCAAGYELVVP